MDRFPRLARWKSSLILEHATILSNFGGECCEMEGAAIAQVCYLNDTPFVVIRAISDKPDETEIVDYPVFEAQAAARCAGIVRYMMERL